jgi:hypothetical protein
MSTQPPMVTISIACTPEQLAEVQARVSALQTNVYQFGIAFSVGACRPELGLPRAVHPAASLAEQCRLAAPCGPVSRRRQQCWRVRRQSGEHSRTQPHGAMQPHVVSRVTGTEPDKRRKHPRRQFQMGGCGCVVPCGPMRPRFSAFSARFCLARRNPGKRSRTQPHGSMEPQALGARPLPLEAHFRAARQGARNAAAFG